MQDVVSADLKKRLWYYIKSRRQEASGVAPLINKKSFLQSNPSAKAEILNEHFQSVYTQEDTDNIPDKGPSPFTSMLEISINSNGVKKLLKDLKPYKASGPDGIPTFILRAASEELTSSFPWIMEKCRQSGEKSSLFHFLIKDKSNNHPTTDLYL